MTSKWFRSRKNKSLGFVHMFSRKITIGYLNYLLILKRQKKENLKQSGDTAQCKAVQVHEGSFILEPLLLFHSFFQL